MIDVNRSAAPTTHIGLQIPNFTYPGVAPDQLFEAVAAQVTAAENSGFDTVFVMDHFFQLPLLGPPSNEMLEAYTLLGALAARTHTVRLGTLVTGVTYRHPAVLAKVVTALDVISGGRALLGIGAAWFELEHDALGVRFPPLTERYEHLNDAVEIASRMFSEPVSSYRGTHHSIADAHNSPGPINGRIPIMVGGQGEKKTFRLAARYADELNANCNFADLPRKLDALEGHLDDIGRPRDDIAVSTLGLMVIAEDEARAVDRLRPRVEAMGWDVAELFSDRSKAEATLGRVIWGGPDEVVDQVQRVMALGLDGLVINLTTDHDPDTVLLAGETLRKAIVASPNPTTSCAGSVES